LNTISNQNNNCAIIPFYNEEETIAEVINRTLNYVDYVIVINDGSTDNSRKNIPQSNRIIYLGHKDNYGKGAALTKGFLESIKNNFELTITIDADLQHLPEKIPDLISALSMYNIVIGNRLNDIKDMPVQRILSNKLTSFLLSRKTGQKIFDSQCGFRGYHTKILKNILPKSQGYEAESEILINAARNNYKIGSVSIPTIYGEENSKMNSLLAIKGFIKTLFM
jgi:glycosyltransferase involved in cell wall biosynthesis